MIKEVIRFTVSLVEAPSKLILSAAVMVCSFSIHAAKLTANDSGIVIRPDHGQARVVCLQVVDDGIVRVRATSADALPQKPQSLIIVPQKAKVNYTVDEADGKLTVKTARMQAVVDKASGAVSFYDANGKVLLREAKEGKRFWPYRVHDREIGVDVSKVSEQQRHGLTWQMLFDSPDDEAFYGLGQHQSEELNMKGRNEELFQYNTKVSVPFVISNKNYGLLWDSYSYCRFGQAVDYMQLGDSLTVDMQPDSTFKFNETAYQNIKARQQEQVDTLLLNEEALELCFEGYRYYDLMRFAMRAENPGKFLTDRVNSRGGKGTNAGIDLTNRQNWYLRWGNGKIGY